MTHAEILRWLRTHEPEQLEPLWRAADAVRRERVGDEVHLRGLVEISNECARSCAYCGLRRGRRDLPRYRMSADEVLRCAHEAAGYGYGTVVLQSGEWPGISRAWVADLVRRIKSETGLAVTLSLGERGEEDFAAWRAAGADRYLLRLETSNAALFRRIHPPLPHRDCDRVALLRSLRALGYEIGSGVMLGIPGQSWSSLADDIALFRALDLDMIGVGPYLPHPDTPLGRGDGFAPLPPEHQVPATELTAYKVVALARLVCPEANIPSTTALATLNLARGRELGLQRGANVIMPNVTPVRYRSQYEIYPAKACVRETAGQCRGCVTGRILAIGRVPGRGHGGRRRHASEPPRA